MSAPRCLNPRCDRELKDTGPSMMYCNHHCSVFDAFNYESVHRDLIYQHSSESDDPTAWSTRSASPKTTKAKISEAFAWLDIRAEQ